MYIRLSTQVFRIFSPGVRSGLPSEDRLMNILSQKQLLSLDAAPVPTRLAGQPQLLAHSNLSTWSCCSSPLQMCCTCLCLCLPWARLCRPPAGGHLPQFDVFTGTEAVAIATICSRQYGPGAHGSRVRHLQARHDVASRKKEEEGQKL